MKLLEIQNLSLEYPSAEGSVVRILDVPALGLDEGERVGLKGRSGSGKTSLLNILSGITLPTNGSVRLLGKDITRMSEAARDVFRGRHIGFIFQTFHLLHGFTALENVVLGSVFAGDENEESSVTRDRARELLVRVGLEKRASHFPRMLSSGEQQRVAIARALLNRPSLILADEPTGALDERNSREVLDLILSLCESSGSALLLATHDPVVMERFPRLLDLKELNKVS